MVAGYLRLRRGLVPGQPLLVAIGGCCGVVWREGPSLLGPFSLPRRDGLPFLLPLGLGERVFLFILLVVVGGVRPGVSDDESGTMLHRELLLVLVAFFLDFFSGTS